MSSASDAADPGKPSQETRNRRAARLTESHLLEAQRIASLGSCEIDIRTQTIACSPEMIRIFGWPGGRTATLQQLRQTIHPDDWSAVEQWLADAHTARLAPTECRFRILRGYDVRMLQGRARAKLADGVKIAGTVQDVTDFMKAQRTSAENALLRRGMFENATWGIFQTTAAGHYLAANQALARIYGYDSPKEMVTSLSDIGRQLYVDPVRRDEFVRLMKANGTVSGFESQVRRRDGSVIWISECCRSVRAIDGRLLFFEGTVEEITPRKRTEEELRGAMEQAEAANRAKTTFLNTMSHELRTPLNSVIGFSEMIEGEILGPLGNDTYRDYVREILGSGRRLLEVINDILDITRIESGRLKLEERVVEVDKVLDTCEAEIAARAERRGVAVTFAHPPKPVSLRADPSRLQQILLNLLSNAVKFSDAGAAVSVSAEEADDGAFVISVRDSGIGMSADEIGRALLPFQQVDASLARRYEGTGLGLTITKSLVELHGGALEIASAPGEGTTATVRLPPQRHVRPAA